MDAQYYIANFKASPLWQVMVDTVEDSPWHREKSVAVHTEMCIDQYLRRFAPHRNERQNRIALIALLMHDTGKPLAEETLDRKDGSGTYRRYAGHEQMSAVTFTEQWLTDPVLRELLTADEARQVRFVIEHHLPYGLKDKQKVQALRTAVAHTFGADEETFYDCLRSDSAGRVSDDHETKLANVEAWIDGFRAGELQVNRIDQSMGNCYVLIGPSGSGKSTWARQMFSASSRVISLDEYRLDFFDQTLGDPKATYAAAWGHAVDNEKEFNTYTAKRIQDDFVNAKISRGRVFIDNTNASKKSRAKYIQAARGVGMRVVGVEFWNTLEVLLARQNTRTDKSVPYGSVNRQYFAQTSSLLGSEVDEVILVPGF